MIGKKSVRQETLSQQHSHAFLVIVLFFCDSDVLGSLKFYKHACFVDQRAYLISWHFESRNFRIEK